MKTKHKYFRKWPDHQVKPDIVAEFTIDQWSEIEKWSNEQVKDALIFLKGFRERLNEAILKFEDLDNFYDENK